MCPQILWLVRIDAKLAPAYYEVHGHEGDAKDTRHGEQSRLDDPILARPAGYYGCGREATERPLQMSLDICERLEGHTADQQVAGCQEEALAEAVL